MRNLKLLFFLFSLMVSFGMFTTACKDKEDNFIKHTITTLDVTNISNNTASCGGNISLNGSEFITSRGICWSTKTNPLIIDNKTADGMGEGYYTSIMTGLISETTYFVRAYAASENDTIYGNELSFITQAATASNTFTDPRDGNVYNYDTIGTQVWMTENLRYLPSVVDPFTGSKVFLYYYIYGYVGTSVNAAKSYTFTYPSGTFSYLTYGVLYNWPAAKEACPKGWHLPSDEEWTQLITYFGGRNKAGSKLKEPIFNALPAGYRIDSGPFWDWGHAAYWWSSTEFPYYDAGNWYITYYSSGDEYNARVNYFTRSKDYGLSVRCVRD